MADELTDLIREIKKKKEMTNKKKFEPVKQDTQPKKVFEKKPIVSPSLPKKVFEKKIPKPPEKKLVREEVEKIRQALGTNVKLKEPEEKIKQPEEKEKEPKKKPFFLKFGKKNKPQEKEIQAPEDEEEEKAKQTQKEFEDSEKKVIESYGEVQIFKIEGKPLMHYTVPVSRPTSIEKTIITTIKEAATRLITISPYKIRDQKQKRNIYYQKVMEILQNSPQLNIQKRRWPFYAEAVVREMVGYGIIDALVNDDNLEEIMVVRPKLPVYIFHRKYEMMTTNIEFYSDQEVIDLINRIARQVGRRVDISSPLLDARLPDGSRVNATIPPASVLGSTLTIRKFKKDPLTIIDLIKNNTLDLETAAFLWICVEGLGVKPANILISGGTGSGKTTLLNALAAFIQEHERIISIEDTAELNLPLKHWIRFEGRPPGLEGSGELSIDIMTKNSLRMRPDRVMVGEIRHAEAFSLFTAMNTGHDGAVRENTLIQLSDGNLVQIGELVEKIFKQKTPITEGKFEFAEVNDNIKVPSFNKQTLKIEEKEVTHVWRKNSASQIIKIKLKSGKTISLSEDHPIYASSNGIQEINADQAQIGQFICTPLQVPIKSKNEEKLKEPYLVGLILGDGHTSNSLVEFANKEKKLTNYFENSMKQLSKNKVTTFRQGKILRSKVHDVKLATYFEKTYSIPKGNKTKTFKLSEKLLSSNQEDVGKIIRGLVDSDGHVNSHSNSIQFSTANKDVKNKLPLILQRFGIQSSVNIQERDGKGTVGPYYRVSIYGKDNLIKFKEKIGFYHPEKSATLQKVIEQSENSLDIFPNISKIIKNVRLENKMTQKELGVLIGNKTRSVIESYETGQRKPTRDQLKRIIAVSNSQKSTRDLSFMVNSDLRFEEIVSIEKEIINEPVYDLTVKDNHNYIANGIIASNCMGTVHANSSKETIIRVTSPPMNVPEVMLSGLDLIIVEQRLHDKKKGTIRRITDISEVSGVLDKKTVTKLTHEYDHVTDKLKRTKNEITILKTLQRFTGWRTERMNQEIEKRKKFLKKLADQNVRSMLDVYNACQEFTYKETNT